MGRKGAEHRVQSADSVLPPQGAPFFSADAYTSMSADTAFGLATNLAWLSAAEPQVLSAEWISGGPYQGARAMVETAIRFRVPWVQRALGPQVGTITLLDYGPPTRLSYRADVSQGWGVVSAELREVRGQTHIAVRGWLYPSRWHQRVALHMFAPLLESLAERATVRFIKRHLGRPTRGR